MRRPAAIWCSLLGGLLAYDVLCDRRRNNSTLCSVIRWIVEHTPGGKVIFRALLILGAVWFDGHILSPIAARIGAIGDPRDAPTPGGPTTT